jgi:hypothetical protein
MRPSPASRPPLPDPPSVRAASGDIAPVVPAVGEVVAAVAAGVVAVVGLGTAEGDFDGFFAEVPDVVEGRGLEPADGLGEEELVLLGFEEVELLDDGVAVGAGGATDGGAPAPNAQPSTVPGAGLLLAGPTL